MPDRILDPSDYFNPTEDSEAQRAINSEKMEEVLYDIIHAINHELQRAAEETEPHEWDLGGENLINVYRIMGSSIEERPSWEIRWNDTDNLLEFCYNNGTAANPHWVVHFAMGLTSAGRLVFKDSAGIVFNTGDEHDGKQIRPIDFNENGEVVFKQPGRDAEFDKLELKELDVDEIEADNIEADNIEADEGEFVTISANNLDVDEVDSGDVLDSGGDTWEGNFDANGYRLQGLPEPTSGTEPIRQDDLHDVDTRPMIYRATKTTVATTTSQNWNDIPDLSFTVTMQQDDSILLIFDFSGDERGTSWAGHDLRLVRNEAPILVGDEYGNRARVHKTIITYPEHRVTGTYSGTAVDSPGSGEYTYSVQWRINQFHGGSARINRSSDWVDSNARKTNASSIVGIIGRSIS